MSLTIDRIIILSCITLGPIIVILESVYSFKKAVKYATNQLIIPLLKSKDLQFCDFELLPNQFINLFKNKGDWENVPIFKLFDDTRYNNKIYAKLRYRTEQQGDDSFTTVKIGLNRFGNAVSVEFYPVLKTKTFCTRSPSDGA